ncbi:twin-arginine translocase subunit TatC [Agarivorans sp. QJM3NY_33]|uniref:twin-arginine translocase subunit TatC n=1 Tax=Agarivorans sp. QJM3NY_33 TaxID=3421432 RepID=UPI003D7DADC2
MSLNRALVQHLVELRKRLLLALASVIFCFVSLVYFANHIYQLLASPLMRYLPAGTSMIATDVATPFFTPIKLTLFCAVALSVPMILYQLWQFIAPGLKRQERNLFAPMLLSGSLLFYLGISFAYMVVLPAAFSFFTATTPQGVTMATDISSYLDFVLALFMAFGLAFEIPILVFLLCKLGLCEVSDLTKARPHVVVASFVLGMLLTPPDIISQTLLAIPMCLLFELGILASRCWINTTPEHTAKLSI